MATAPAAHSRATACLEVATSGDSRSGPFSPAGRARRAAGPREGEDDSAAARSTAEAAGELVLLTAGFGFQLCGAPRRRLLVVALAAYLALRPALGTRRITLRTREPQLTEHLGRRPTVTHHFPFRPLPGHGDRLAAARPAPESTVARTARQPLFTSDAHTRASRAGQPPAGLLLLIQPRRLTRDARGARSQAVAGARSAPSACRQAAWEAGEHPHG